MRGMWILAAAVAASVSAAPATAQDGEIAVSGSCAVAEIVPAAIPVIEVMIGGAPYRFAIDTGAQGHGRISTELAEKLGLEVVGEVGTPAPGGAVATRPVYGLPELSVGEVSLRGLELVALSTVRGPATEWDGIIGNDVLKALPLTLDYGNARVRLGGAALREGVAIAFDRGIPLLPVEIDGRRFEVHFDSGNGAGALFLDEEAARALPLAGEPAERGRARTSFGEFAIMEAPIAVPVTVGGAELPVTAIGWPSPRPGGNLGSKGMAGMVVTIDGATGRAAIAPSGAPLACPA